MFLRILTYVIFEIPIKQQAYEVRFNYRGLLINSATRSVIRYNRRHSLRV